MSSLRLLPLLLLAASPLAAQHRAHWGDELPAVSPLSFATRSDTVAWPAPPASTVPAPVRAVYVNAWAFGTSRFGRLLDLVEGTEVNSLVIDVKDDTGYLTFRSEVPTAIAIGANSQLRARDTRARIEAMRARGLHPIARIVVAKDPLLAARKPQWAIQDRNGGLWHDRAGRAWVDAYQDSVWIYAAQLAAEAVHMGFAEIQYDYVRFPDEPPSRRATAMFSGRKEGETLRDGVADGLKILRERTRTLGVPFTIDVFGLTTSATSDMGIGQVWEDLASLSDAVLPMVYPSHYYKGEYGVARPNAEPYAMVHRAMRDAKRRSEGLGASAEIRPYLQAFTLGAPHYTPEMVRAQIRAAADLGIHGWVLWNPRSVYERGQIVPDRGTTNLARSAE